jgi:hypothetical protein
MAETDVAVQCENEDCTEYGIAKYGSASMVADGVTCGACWHPCVPLPDDEAAPR